MGVVRLKRRDLLMEKQCGCTGVRSCLLCEGEARKRSPLTVTTPALSFVQCHRCGELKTNSDVTRCHMTCTPKRIWEPCLSVPSELEGGGVQFGGVRVIQDFVSKREEEETIRTIDQQLWAESQSGRRKQDYGPKVNFKRQKVKLGSFSGLPSFSENFVKRIVGEVEGMCDFTPVELCNLDYRPERGAAIDPHMDDTWLWGDRLVTLNLLSDTTLTFSTPDSSQCVEVAIYMPRYSLIVVSGRARFQWQHSIRREDVTSRRVAVTLRELSKEFLPGGASYPEIGKTILHTAALFNGLPTNQLHL